MKAAPNTNRGAAPDSPAVQHYWFITGFFVLVLACAGANISEFSEAAFHGGMTSNPRTLHILLAVDSAAIIALSFVIYFRRQPKPWTLRAADARVLGCRWAIFLGIITVGFITDLILWPGRQHTSKSDYVGLIATGTPMWLAPAYWFWRAKRLTPQPPSPPAESSGHK